MRTFLKIYRLEIGLLFLGISLRLLVAFFTNHIYDFINILALVRSVAETGDLSPGVVVLHRYWSNLQLYGKLYYQIPALWLHVLEWIGILDIRYLLDTKAYSSPDSYLDGLNSWGVPLYQLTAIKLSQFLWDFLLLFGMIKLAGALHIGNRFRIIAFWAFNPFIMLIGYTIFMSDLAMTSVLVIGLWLWIKAHNEQNDRKRIIFGSSSLVAMVVGAVIKQVPLLLIPFILHSLTRNLRQGLIYIAVTGFSYFFLSQFWTADGALLKQFFLMSKESLAIFDSTINGISIFLFLYVGFLGSTLLYKDIYYKKSENILYISTIVLMIIYFSALNSLLFVQFFLWMIPLVALIALKNVRLTWIFALASVSTIVKIVHSSDYMTTLLSPTIGAGFADYIQYAAIYKHFINPILVDKGLILFEAIVFILIASSLLFTMQNKETRLTTLLSRFPLTFTGSVIGIFGLYILCFGIDYPIKARHIILPQNEFQIQNTAYLLTDKPISVKIDNSAGHTIRTVDLFIKKQKYVTLDSVVMTFSENGNVFFTQKIPDFALPTDTENPYIIFLDKPITRKKFEISLRKERGRNEIVLPEVRILKQQLNKPKNARYIGYDGFRNSEIVYAKFSHKAFGISFRGDYKWWYVARGVAFHVRQKPTFFIGYFVFTTMLLGSGLWLVLPPIKKHFSHS